jgi:predicted protein tyrosine phosphatase
VRSAGTSPWATTPVTRELLRWADLVFVMSEKDDGHRTLLRMRFPDVKCEVKDLDVEDRWPRGHPELVKRLLKKLQPHLGKPSGGTRPE